MERGAHTWSYIVRIGCSTVTTEPWFHTQLWNVSQDTPITRWELRLIKSWCSEIFEELGQLQQKRTTHCSLSMADESEIYLILRIDVEVWVEISNMFCSSMHANQ